MKMARQKKTPKKGKRGNRSLIILSILLCAIFLILAYIEINVTGLKILREQGENDAKYLQLLIKNSMDMAVYGERDFVEEILFQIEENYPTSPSSYVVVARNDQLVFVMDNEVSDEYMGYHIEHYLNPYDKDKNELDGDSNSYEITLNDNKDYIITTFQQEDGEDIITVAMVTRSSYLIENLSFNTLLIHIIFYLILFGICFLTVVVFLVYRETEKEQLMEELRLNSTIDRQHIDKLEGRLQSSEQKENIGEFNFFPKEIVDEVEEKLTLEQKKKSVCIILKADDIEQRALLQIAIMIDRMHLSKSLSCYLGDKTFKVILLNRKKHTAESFVQQLFALYEQNFGMDIPKIDYVIESLEGN